MAGRIPGQGSKWCRRSTRLAIYHRDGFCCVYCGAAGEDVGTGLTLDHLVACDMGGTNDPTNLVTACLSCNSAKQAKTKRQWFRYLRDRGQSTDRIARRIRALVRKPLDRSEGRRLERVRATRSGNIKNHRSSDSVRPRRKRKEPHELRRKLLVRDT